MGNVWRLQTKTDSKDGKKISTYCKEESIAAVGWSINDDQIKEYNAEAFDKIQSIRASIQSKDIYYKVLEEYNLFNIKPGKKIVAVETIKRVKPGDYIWMRDNGIYYLGRVNENSNFMYNCDKDALDFDAANQITGVKWERIGDESQVPGAVATAFIRGRTIQRINKDYMFEYAEYAFGGKPLVLEHSNREFLQQLFYDCLSPNDCEDLVCLYLYDKANYIAIPSTNKIATELYECVLVNPINGKLAYPQVKKGNKELNINDYIELIKDHPNKEVYLFTSEGKVQGDTHIDNIHSISPDELYSWAKEKIEGNSFLIPEGIVKWYKLIHSSEK
jgi:hypothetical protein